MFTVLQWVLLGSLFVPALTVLGLVSILRWVRLRKRERSPVSDKLLRSPGESLRKEIEKMDEHINDILIWTFFGPAFFAAVLMLFNSGLKPSDSSVIVAIIVPAAAAVFGLLIWRLIYLLNRRRDFRLGFAGERAVAEELNQLMLDGCRVFHDVPMEPYGNIDHVVVAPTGVYAVETKARRKTKTPDGKWNYEIVFDGKTLRLPGGADSRPLDQAKQQTDRLGAFLSEAVGDPVKVGAILTFPGWYITGGVKTGIQVLNPKLIRGAVLNDRSSMLPKQLINRVVYQLDRKCRDVEF